MDCWTCRRGAVGVCRFCGRGVCSDHVDTKPYLLDVYASEGTVRGLVVDDALACSHCHPRPSPIDLPELA